MNNKAKAKDGKGKEALGILTVVLVTAALLFGLMALSRCEFKKPPHKSTVEEIKVTDTKTGIVYIECPEGIGPDTVRKEDGVYMKGEIDGKTVCFYTVGGESPKKFLTKETESGYRLYRAESVSLPSVTEFAPVAAALFIGNTEGVYNRYVDFFYYNVGTDESREPDTVYVNAIAEALAGKDVSEATGEWGDQWYRIRLYSKAYPGLYYDVDFREDVNGAAYLYDTVTGKLVDSPRVLTARILE